MTLKSVIAEGLGATILPWSMAREVAGDCRRGVGILWTRSSRPH